MNELWTNRQGYLRTTSLSAPLVDYMPWVRKGIVWDLPRSRLAFFFQAEDGIRDDLVTGVQTCALPISRREGARRDAHVHRWLQVAARSAGPRQVHVLLLRARTPPGGDGRDADGLVRLYVCWGTFPTPRSEERRVGKEWRSRWSR